MIKVLVIISSILLAGGGFWAYSTYNFIERAERTSGRVIEMIPRQSDGSTTYAPRYRYSGPDGQVYEVTSRTSSNPPSYSVGEQVEVLYDPKDPEHAKLDGLFSLWLGPMILGFIGLVFAGIGVMVLRGSRRHNLDRAYLESRGRPYMATYQGVEREDDAYYVCANYRDPASGLLQRFRSEPLDKNPSEQIRPEQLITVLVHPRLADIYYMDLSFLAGEST